MKYFDVKLKKDVNGIIHRDLKPDNCLVTDNYTLKIADFGEARELDDENSMTQTGTPLYTAPEVLKGYRYTNKADVYSFALTLLQFALKRRHLKEFLRRSLPQRKNIDSYSISFMQHKMVSIDWRPSLKMLEENTPPCILGLIKVCWLPDPEARPSFDEIEKFLGVDGKREIFGSAQASTTRRSSATGFYSLGRRVAEMEDEMEDDDSDSETQTGEKFWMKKCATLEEKIVQLQEKLEKEESSGTVRNDNE
jgi:serine/threonine protein kinase